MITLLLGALFLFAAFLQYRLLKSMSRPLPETENNLYVKARRLQTVGKAMFVVALLMTLILALAIASGSSTLFIVTAAFNVGASFWVALWTQRMSDKVQKALERVIIISLKISLGDEPLEIILRPTLESWPPAELCLSLRGWVTPIIQLKRPHDVLNDILGAEDMLNPAWLEKFSKSLAAANVEHPLDIRGIDELPVLRAFIEKALSQTNTTNKPDHA
jgi:hypothetical protein